jgi:hypothetical protein
MKEATSDNNDSPMPTAAPQVDRASAPRVTPNMKEMAHKLGVETVAAAWPSGASGLAAAVSTCQRCGSFDVCTDWLGQAPGEIVSAPAFCPNAEAFERARNRKTS